VSRVRCTWTSPSSIAREIIGFASTSTCPTAKVHLMLQAPAFERETATRHQRTVARLPPR
jgi:hypothetical protein